MYPVPLTSRDTVRFKECIDTSLALHQAQQELIARYSGCCEDDALITLHPVRQCHMQVERQPEPGLGQASAFQLAQMYVTRYVGEFYAFMMSHDMVAKTDNYVGWTVNPLLDVVMYNAREMGDRSISAAAGSWVLDIVLGPFPCKEEARRCGLAWVDGTRGKQPKRKKAPWLAEQFNTNMYDARLKPAGESVAQYLDRETLPQFSRLYAGVDSM